MNDFEIGDRVEVCFSNWKPGATGTIVEYYPELDKPVGHPHHSFVYCWKVKMDPDTAFGIYDNKKKTEEYQNGGRNVLKKIKPYDVPEPIARVQRIR